MHVCIQFLASCSDGDLKLVGGSVASEGRLEICFDKRWTTIDGDGWTLPDTQVACKQLGYPTSGQFLAYLCEICMLIWIHVQILHMSQLPDHQKFSQF